jgi:hypothetical protein
MSCTHQHIRSRAMQLTITKILEKSQTSNSFLINSYDYSLNKYKHEADERAERIRKQEEESKIPPGTRLMGEEERMSTL